ncbi:MAG: radical SAM protein [Candidatus Woesearchaeota archaeon]
MRIVFVSSPLRDYALDKKKEYDTVPPIGLGYMATILQNAGHTIKLIDGEALGLSPAEIVSSVKSFKPDYACFTILSPTYELIKGIIAELDDIKIIVGGIHATLFPEKVLRETNAYALVRGEGEDTLKELIAHGRDVDGVSYLSDSGIVHNPDRHLIMELDSLPFIDRSLFVNEKYSAVILGSRGCPYNCVFCSASKPTGSVVRERSIKNIVDEIEHIVSSGIHDFHFIDNNFAHTEERVLTFIHELNRRKLVVKWRILSRADVIARFNENTIDLMAKNGCYKISFGLESGSSRVLKLMNKGITLEDSRKAIAVCRKYGIRTKAYFMFGMPTETLQEIEETLQFAEEIKPDIVCFSVIRAFPGTPLYNELNAKGYKELDRYSHIHDTIPETEKELYRFIKYQLSNKASLSDIELPELVRLVQNAYKRFYGGQKNENLHSVQV